MERYNTNELAMQLHHQQKNQIMMQIIFIEALIASLKYFISFLKILPLKKEFTEN